MDIKGAITGRNLQTDKLLADIQNANIQTTKLSYLISNCLCKRKIKTRHSAAEQRAAKTFGGIMLIYLTRGQFFCER